MASRAKRCKSSQRRGNIHTSFPPSYRKCKKCKKRKNLVWHWQKQRQSCVFVKCRPLEASPRQLFQTLLPAPLHSLRGTPTRVPFKNLNNSLLVGLSLIYVCWHLFVRLLTFGSWKLVPLVLVDWVQAWLFQTSTFSHLFNCGWQITFGLSWPSASLAVSNIHLFSFV